MGRFLPDTKERCEDCAMSASSENHPTDNLIELLQDADPLVRIQAGFALGTMGDEALRAVPVLIEMLIYGEVQDRKLAATTLGQIGPVAADAVPALLEATADEDEVVADLAIAALEEIDLADEDEISEAA
jgi:HEAT repeat protein